MKPKLALLLWLSVVITPRASAQRLEPKPAPVVSDFKLVMTLFGVEKQPVAVVDLVVKNGIAYQFSSETPEELIVIEPARGRVLLLDLDRKIQTELTALRLDAGLTEIYRASLKEVERQEKSALRSDKVAAEISRNLIQPRFQIVAGSGPFLTKLSNPTVSVELRCEEERDRLRLNMITNSLAALTKIGTLRDPEMIPPFSHLATIRHASELGNQRIAEVTYLYRLAGPPSKDRWTYQVVNELSDREKAVIPRIEKIRAATPFVTFDAYEAEAEE